MGRQLRKIGKDNIIFFSLDFNFSSVLSAERLLFYFYQWVCVWECEVTSLVTTVYVVSVLFCGTFAMEVRKF